MFRDVYPDPPGTPHYTFMFKSGGVRKRVTERSLRGLRVAEVDWLWVVEQKRRATPDALFTTTFISRTAAALKAGSLNAPFAVSAQWTSTGYGLSPSDEALLHFLHCGAKGFLGFGGWTQGHRLCDVKICLSGCFARWQRDTVGEEAVPGLNEVVRVVA